MKHEPLKPSDRKYLRRLWIVLGVVVVVLVLVASSVVLYISAKLNQKLLSQEPNYTPAQLYDQAVAQTSQGDYTTAQQYLENALQQQDDSTFRNKLAVVDYRLKQYDKSIAEYKKLIDAGQNVSFAWNGIGNCYRDWADTDQAQQAARLALAEEAYRKVLTIDPQNTATYSNLALMLNDHNRKTDALAVLDEGIRVTKQSVLQDVRRNIAD